MKSRLITGIRVFCNVVKSAAAKEGIGELSIGGQEMLKRCTSIRFICVLLSLFLLSSSCSKTSLTGGQEVYPSYEKAIAKISQDINVFILQETKANRLPLVLDFFIDDFFERTTGNKIRFGEKLGKDFSVFLNESRDSMSEEFKRQESDVIYHFSKTNYQKSFLIRGTFHQLDKDWVQVNVELYRIADKNVLSTHEFAFPLADVQSIHFEDFASQVDLRFKRFKDRIQKVDLLSMNVYLAGSTLVPTIYQTKWKGSIRNS